MTSTPATPSAGAADASGDRSGPQTQRRLFASLYDDLHRLARRQLRQHGGGVTMGGTTLLHEAYENMARSSGLVFPDHARFMAYVTRVMRGLIVDRVRERKAIRNGGQAAFTRFETWMDDVLPDRPDAERWLQELHDALCELADQDAGLAELVVLKYFFGLGEHEIAALREVDTRTVQRHWAEARGRLHLSMRGGPMPPSRQRPDRSA